jgi:hypothetical protein
MSWNIERFYAKSLADYFFKDSYVVYDSHLGEIWARCAGWTIKGGEPEFVNNYRSTCRDPAKHTDFS